jgi:predicted amidophosphoribosyltransferase
MEWPREDETMFDQLVYRLKASQSPQAIEFYSDLLAEKLVELQKPGSFRALIPVPGSSKSRNHSERIARRLSQQTGFKTLPVLEKVPSSNQQKILSSFERRIHNPFKLIANAPEEFTTYRQCSGPFIFVDDVLTTGQSIKHAEHVLNCTKPNAVATLFYRPPLM